MGKDLHDIDNLFRSSLGSYEETPPRYVKERLDAALDKSDAESYKKRFLFRKRATIMLFVLLLGFLIYNAGILPFRPGNSKNKHAVEKTKQPVSDGQTNEKADLSLTGKKNTAPGTPPELSSSKQPFDKRHQQSSPIKQTPFADNPTIIDNNHNTSFIDSLSNISGEDLYAYPLLQKNNPSASISRKPVSPQINRDAFLKGPILSKNQNKDRIGFKPHWLIGAVFSYEAAGYKLDSDLPNEISNIKHREVHEPSYSGGILVTRQLTFNWGLQSGLLYSKTDIGIGPQKIYAFLDPSGDVAYKYITSSGYAYIKPKSGSPPSFGDSVLATEGKHTLRYITVPFAVKYKVGNKKFSFVPGLGIEGNILTETRVETEIQTPTNNELVFFNKLYGAKSFYWSLAADAEIRYNMNQKTMISFRPSFHHSISPITENNIVETYPYSFRWGVGLTFKL